MPKGGIMVGIPAKNIKIGNKKPLMQVLHLTRLLKIKFVLMNIVNFTPIELLLGGLIID
ncbi:MAG: hypothetical protein CM15mP70_11080 [Pelagibacteraceae bacterium]|nr:MAG: hypothetical protein CM15mP70_11080 [Pelagibacteraceae bacterium]